MKRLLLSIFLLISIVLSVMAQDTPEPPDSVVSLQGSSNTGQVQLLGMPEIVTRTGISSWRDAGFEGRGMRIGILDQGFGGITSFEEENGVVVNFVSSEDTVTINEDAIIHGTNVIRVIHSIAPAAEFYACRYFTFDEFVTCIDWMRRSEVRIINHSAGVPARPLNGENQWALEVERVARDGILWVNSAGNFANGFFSDAFTDSNDNSFHEYRGVSGVVESLEIAGTDQAYGRIMLSWERLDGLVDNTINLDLYAIDSFGNYTSSTNIQEGAIGDEALEYIQMDMSEPFEIRIQQISDGNEFVPVRFYLFVEFAAIPTGRSQGSIIAPGDSQYSLTVGALQGRLVAPYSSQGPIDNGVIKPDLVAPGEILLPNGEVFVGTSAAAPVVAGVAALVWEINPELTRTQIYELIRGSMTSDDTVLIGPDTTFGFGILDLQLPQNVDTSSQQVVLNPTPYQTATPVPPSEPIQQARVFVTDEGLKLRDGPGTVFNVIENMPSGTVVTILDGPVNAEGYVWYQVESAAGNVGWSVEGADGLVTLVFLPQSPVAIPTPSIRCVLVGLTDAYMRSGPGGNFRDDGFLPQGQNAADAQAIGSDGYVWWRLTSGLWVRSDVVSEFGDCDQLPAAPGQ